MKDNEMFDRYLKGEQLPNYKSLSEIEFKEVYTKEDVNREEPPPAEFPYTRGIHKEMYRKRLWTRRQQSGFGTPEESNERLLYLLKHGMTGLNIDFDVATKLGIDPDHPLAQGDVGLQGTSLATLEDMDILFQGIPLDKASTSMTINATAPILLAMYIALGKKQGVEPAKLNGTTQNDILKEYIARGTHIFPPRPSMRLTTDIFAYCAKNIPRWNTISISGYHIREAGSTAAQEIGSYRCWA